MEIVAHRGCAGQFPENTVRAAVSAAGRADWIEIDLRRCADAVVVFHDDTLDRLTGAEGRLAETPWTELRELSILGTGAGVPRFDDLLEAVPSDTGVILDVKEPGIVREALRTAAAGPNDVMVLTGSDAILREALDAGASPPVGYIDPFADATDVREIANRGCDFFYGNFEHCATTGIVATAHDAGLAVNAGTIRTDAEARHVSALRDRGVEFLSVDRLDFPELRGD